MIHVMRAEARHLTDFGWLKTSWWFSFSAYYDPANIPCGALRVCNDDVVAPHTGFGTHPHQEMEIITVVLDGAITHEDSLGTKAVIRAGEVQRMAAGTGIRPAECNLGEVPAHCYQQATFRGIRSEGARAWTVVQTPLSRGVGDPRHRHRQAPGGR